MCFGTGRRYCITKDGIPYLTVDTVETYHQMHLPCCIYRNQLYIADYWNLHQIDLDTLAHCVREDIKFFYFGYFEPLADQLLFSTDSDVYALDGSGKILWHAPIPQENRDAFYNEAFLKTAESYCAQLISRLSLDAEGRCSGGFRYIRVKAIAIFIYMYAHSLLRTFHAANYSIIEPIFTDYLKKKTDRRWIYEDEILPEIQAVCRADYFQKPQFSELSKPLEHFQAAVWALTNSHSYMEAMQNILEFVNYQHDKKLAVILTGIFAGIYYQHYDIPKNYLTENRYYGRFSMSIVPLTHPVYNGKRH